MSNGRREEWLQEWEACQRRKGLRRSRPRQIVVDAFLEAPGHLSVDDLYRSVGERDSAVGYATVYRTIRLLQDCGLATERRFGQGAARFEPAGPLKQDHSHFVCTSCGLVVEFPCDTIPSQLAAAAEQHGFEVERCSVDAVGVCAACRPKERAGENEAPCGSVDAAGPRD